MIDLPRGLQSIKEGSRLVLHLAARKLCKGKSLGYEEGKIGEVQIWNCEIVVGSFLIQTLHKQEGFSRDLQRLAEKSSFLKETQQS